MAPPVRPPLYPSPHQQRSSFVLPPQRPSVLISQSERMTSRDLVAHTRKPTIPRPTYPPMKPSTATTRSHSHTRHSSHKPSRQKISYRDQYSFGHTSASDSESFLEHQAREVRKTRDVPCARRQGRSVKRTPAARQTRSISTCSSSYQIKLTESPSTTQIRLTDNHRRCVCHHAKHHSHCRKHRSHKLRESVCSHVHPPRQPSTSAPPAQKAPRSAPAMNVQSATYYPSQPQVVPPPNLSGVNNYTSVVQPTYRPPVSIPTSPSYSYGASGYATRGENGYGYGVAPPACTWYVPPVGEAGARRQLAPVANVMPRSPSTLPMPARAAEVRQRSASFSQNAASDEFDVISSEEGSEVWAQREPRLFPDFRRTVKSPQRKGGCC